MNKKIVFIVIAVVLILSVTAFFIYNNLKKAKDQGLSTDLLKKIEEKATEKKPVTLGPGEKIVGSRQEAARYAYFYDGPNGEIIAGTNPV